ncbi:MAG: cofactor assembly of complex C subunit B [Acaryochloridaceae cyanobacterium RU_4_10]|nr:cofactor assembly of complex C subunit B [Acaryochloridaceae cyanobacterium RU_4_10]
MAQQDPNRVLRLMPTIVGVLGSTLLVLNRLLLTGDLTGSQSRSDALGVILSALLILTGLLWQRVQPRTPEAVELIGEQGFEIDSTLPESVRVELAWASYSLLTNTPTQSMAIWSDGKTLLRRGVLGVDANVTPGPIVQRSLQTEKPVYLVSLKLYPGRVEFTYLPENTQAVICQPLGKQGVMVLGANAPRSYTQDHEAWVSAIADKLTKTLNSMS